MGVPVIGIDSQTTNIAWVHISDERVEPHQVKAQGRRADDRFIPLTRAFHISLETTMFPFMGTLPLFYLEKPMLTRNGQATVQQSMVVGAVRETLRGFGFPHTLVDPGVWKKTLLGNGHASKDEIKSFAIQVLDLPDNLDQDVYDAAAIAQYGRVVSSR